MKNITLILFALFAFNFVGGQEIVSFSSLASSTCSGTISSDANITSTGICRGPGIVEHTGATYNSRNWTDLLSIDSDDYIEWALTPASGYQIDLSTMDITYDRSGSGPSQVDIQIDYGLGFVSIFTDASVSDSSEDNNGIDLSSITEIKETITFRLYAFNATSQLGTFDIEENSTTNKGIIINGNVSPIPPCSDVTTWTSTGWSNGVPTINTAVFISDDYNTGNGGDEISFQACSLTVDSGAILTVNNNTYIEVENNVTVNGELYVESSGNFVQNDTAGTFNLGASGIARVNKVTPFKSKWYYYTYWSSPVKNQFIEDAFPNVDGDRRFWYDATKLQDANGDGIDDSGADDWQYALAGTIMTPGRGYASTEARNFDNTPFGGGSGAEGTATFEGEFNTRDIPIGIYHSAANLAETWNFIGNPYPSAIDFVAFQAANSSLIGGSVYLWSQSKKPSSENAGNRQLNFSQNDYAIFTVGTGGVQAGAGGVMPNGYIASAQGFFIDGISSGTATFTNAMRMADGTSNSQFFKSSTKSEKTNARNPLENRLWVNLTSDNGAFNQILIGYVENATEYDDGSLYDAKRIVSGDYPAALYSIIENSNKKFAIQGKNINSINEDETIQLGFKTTINVATLYTLSIAKMEGDFLNSHSVFVKDKLLNKVHDLTVCDYTFTSETGEFNNRFEIVFKADALTTANALANPSQLKIAQLDNDNVQFTAPNGLRIKTVSIFDLYGRQLYQFNGQNDTEIFKLSNLNRSVFVAEVVLSNGTVISKKAIKR